MIVTVIKAGIYAGPGWLALPPADEGATIEIQGGWYAQAMIDGGYVAVPVEPEATPVEPVKKKGK